VECIDVGKNMNEDILLLEEGRIILSPV